MTEQNDEVRKRLKEEFRRIRESKWDYRKNSTGDKSIMKIQVQFDIATERDLEEFFEYMNSMDSIQDWKVKKCPKRYKKVVEDYV